MAACESRKIFFDEVKSSPLDQPHAGIAHYLAYFFPVSGPVTMGLTLFACGLWIVRAENALGSGVKEKLQAICAIAEFYRRQVTPHRAARFGPRSHGIWVPVRAVYVYEFGKDFNVLTDLFIKRGSGIINIFRNDHSRLVMPISTH